MTSPASAAFVLQRATRPSIINQPALLRVKVATEKNIINYLLWSPSECKPNKEAETPCLASSDRLSPTSVSPIAASATVPCATSPALVSSLKEPSRLSTIQLSVKASMDCLPPPASAGDAGVPIPRRNLSEAFEELYVSTPDVLDQLHQVDTTAVTTPSVKQSSLQNSANDTSHQQVQNEVRPNLISPTGVADLPAVATPNASNKDKTGTNEKKVDFSKVAPITMIDPVDSTTNPTEEMSPTLPPFQLHQDLQKNLSQAVINRVSFYGVIHGINKEATSMAANDDSGLDRVSPGEDNNEDCSPLVESVKGARSTAPAPESGMFQMALVDEERWLLSAIELRGTDEYQSIQSCPPTFPQAMGECEYENPLTSLSSGSRTQLWKPSRSWWEAKSGKNPWIEPKSHSKRWRYVSQAGSPVENPVCFYWPTLSSTCHAVTHCSDSPFFTFSLLRVALCLFA